MYNEYNTYVIGSDNNHFIREKNISVSVISIVTRTIFGKSVIGIENDVSIMECA